MDGPQEISPGLFIAGYIDLFDKRQQWNGQFPENSDSYTMNVGAGETLQFSRNRQPGEMSISQRTSQLAAIREIVQTGTVQVPTFRNVKKHVASLRQELDTLSEPAESITMILEMLQTAVKGEELQYVDRKIQRVAGYIAARENLWVVTRTDAKAGSGRYPALGLSVARLAGVALVPQVQDVRYTVPVVRGKNGQLGLLQDVSRVSNGQRRPKVLDVLEGARTLPK